MLLHVEIQSQWEARFAERVFIYNLRIFDLYCQFPVSLAILCDERLSWRPKSYTVNYPDTRFNFEFGIVKLLDWRDRMNELESSDNPFAVVVLAHLKVIETKGSVELRKAWKFRLTKMLYEKGHERQQILDLYRFVDWVMILPEAVERAFWQELQSYEEETKVTYVTNVERFGIEKGERSLILRQLTRRIGILSPENRSQVESLSIEQLESLGEALLDFSNSSDLEQWLRTFGA